MKTLVELMIVLMVLWIVFILGWDVVAETGLANISPPRELPYVVRAWIGIGTITGALITVVGAMFYWDAD